MGLDIGKKTIGLALGDPNHQIASPYRILWRQKFTPDAHNLIADIEEHNIGALVLGWPLNMDGKPGPRCDSVRDFAYAFLRLYDVPVCFHDERLSTKAVEATMLEADLSRGRRAEKRDALAASWILQSAFDLLSNDISADAPLITD
ncbi:MAG: Putative pre-16S rRNA nuclease [Alphaproteobacteria bacterium UBA4588]|nr:MAG: Putative pre-16S rRNA nuclease [Alphaproteobacteria bacterium UBA4588]